MSDHVMELRRRAAAGDPLSQYQLARILLVGREAPPDAAMALKLVRDACAQNFPQALLFHATLAALGFGRTQSWGDAISYVGQAAATGDERAQGQLAALGGVSGFKPEAWFEERPVIQHCDAPRVFTVKNFLSRDACAWLIDQARRRLVSARVKDPETGVAAVDEQMRTNSGAGFSAIESDLILQLTCLRISAAVGLPLIQQEPTNVLHYAPGQQYRSHYDFIVSGDEAAFADELRRLGQRVCTVLVYLNDDYEGGETDFPRLNWQFKGETGDALIFWNLSATGERERFSLHAGLPVTSGEKWLLSKWIREKPYPLI